VSILKLVFFGFDLGSATMISSFGSSTVCYGCPSYLKKFGFTAHLKIDFGFSFACLSSF